MNVLNPFARLWKYKVQEMEEFLNLTDSGISLKYEEFGEWLKSKTKGMDKERVAEFIDLYYDDLAMVRDIAPHMLRYAQYLCVFGAFEHAAGDLCRVLHRDGKVSVAPPSRNFYLDRIEKYLRKKAALGKAAFGKDWKFMLDARYPRNAIAHADGMVGTDAQGKKARAFIRTQPKLDLERLPKVFSDSCHSQRARLCQARATGCDANQITCTIKKEL
jgi:hypothetical protein